MDLSSIGYYYSFDHLGSTREMLNSSGSIVARYQYDAFGNATVVSGTDMATFQFAQTMKHQPSGENFTQWRIYDAPTGRWRSHDPMGEFAGTNLYGYVGNNPLNGIDPLGLMMIVSPWANMGHAIQNLSRDPIGEDGSINLYEYCLNEAIAFTDVLGLRPLTDCEKKTLAPYIPQADLDTADIHENGFPFPQSVTLPKSDIGLALHNDIYFRKGAYDPNTPAGLALLGHELIHHGQYRNGMGYADYLAEAAKNGSGPKNKYEAPAYAMQDRIDAELTARGFKGCPDAQSPPPNATPSVTPPSPIPVIPKPNTDESFP